MSKELDALDGIVQIPLIDMINYCFEGSTSKKSSEKRNNALTVSTLDSKESLNNRVSKGSTVILLDTGDFTTITKHQHIFKMNLVEKNCGFNQIKPINATEFFDRVISQLNISLEELAEKLEIDLAIIEHIFIKHNIIPHSFIIYVHLMTDISMKILLGL